MIAEPVVPATPHTLERAETVSPYNSDHNRALSPGKKIVVEPLRHRARDSEESSMKAANNRRRECHGRYTRGCAGNDLKWVTDVITMDL